VFFLFRLLRRGLALVLLIVVVYATVTFAQVWLKARADGADGVQQAEAIVVLGAAQYNGRPSPVLRARLDHAAELYKRDLAPLIVVTGGQIDGDATRNTEASASADYLAREHGIDQNVILRENQGCNTWD
jgi:uncharacterized SAM-binding protein YcdF (DUF218 family)